MIKALNIATQGLLQAERRATDIAQDILKTTSDGASFKVEAPDTHEEPADRSSTKAASQSSKPNGGGPNVPNFGNLIQQFAELRAEETAYKASASAFKKIDETLGTLLDNES